MAKVESKHSVRQVMIRDLVADYFATDKPHTSTVLKAISDLGGSETLGWVEANLRRIVENINESRKAKSNGEARANRLAELGLLLAQSQQSAEFIDWVVSQVTRGKEATTEKTRAAMGL